MSGQPLCGGDLPDCCEACSWRRAQAERDVAEGQVQVYQGRPGSDWEGFSATSRAARFTAMVVLPVPPFGDSTEMTRPPALAVRSGVAWLTGRPRPWPLAVAESPC